MKTLPLWKNFHGFLKTHNSQQNVQQTFLKDVSGILRHILQDVSRSKHKNLFFWWEGVDMNAFIASFWQRQSQTTLYGLLGRDLSTRNKLA